MAVKVLIVEDEALIASTIIDELTEKNYVVVGHSYSKQETIDLLDQLKSENNLPNIVLLDICLKQNGDNERNSDGIILAKYLTENYNIPFIFLTAYDDDDTFQETLNVNPGAYLPKPLPSTNIISRTIQVVLYQIELEKEVRKNENSKLELLEKLSEYISARVSIIQNCVEQIIDGDLSQEELDQFYDMIKGNYLNIRIQINTMNDYMKYSSPVSKTNFRSIELFEIIKSISIDKEIMHFIKVNNIELEIKKNHNYNHFVSADINQLKTIVFQLLFNAIKFSHDSKVIIIISLNEEEKSILEIIDSGNGIPIHVLENYNSLLKSDTTYTKTHGEKLGCGVGLPLAKLLCDNNNIVLDLLCKNGGTIARMNFAS